VLRWAAVSGWLAIAASIAGNATFHAIETGRGAELVAGQWRAGIVIVVLVGAAPAVFVGAAVTLLHLARPDLSPAEPPAPVGPPRVVGDVPPLPEPELPVASPAATTGAPVRAGSKAAELRALVLAEVEPGDGRSISELARVYGPRVGLHEASARKTIAATLRERPTSATAADAAVVRLSARGVSR
jgi:hypothetical protein